VPTLLHAAGKNELSHPIQRENHIFGNPGGVKRVRSMTSRVERSQTSRGDKMTRERSAFHMEHSLESRCEELHIWLPLETGLELWRE